MRKLVILIVFALTCSAWANYEGTVMSDTPLSYWEFNDSSSANGAAITDTMGLVTGQYRNASTSLSDITLTAGHSGCGTAATFYGDSGGGKGNFVDIVDNGYNGNKLTLPTMSIEVAFRTTASASNYPTLFSHGSNTAPILSNGNYAGPPVQTYQPFVTAANSTWYAWPPGILGDGNWHLYDVTFAYDGTNTQSAIYIDGQLKGTHQFAGQITPNATLYQDLIIGAGNNQYYTYNSFVGDMDEMSVYNTALSQDVITRHWVAYAPEPTTIALLGLGLALLRKRS